ncbi:hypothetical protein [uncultured Nostoc sp.]|uniref:hypothetical protein n=1 Tax=uncultured Nostoc sp. TaxID=340711 RepID=UPI0035CA909C
MSDDKLILYERLRQRVYALAVSSFSIPMTAKDLKLSSHSGFSYSDRVAKKMDKVELKI